MTDAAVLERLAHRIAENAVIRFEQDRDGSWFHPTGRETAVRILMRELLAVMPTESGHVLAEACNRGLDAQEAMGMPGPRVATVDIGDGAVTMRDP